MSKLVFSNSFLNNPFFSTNSLVISWSWLKMCIFPLISYLSLSLSLSLSLPEHQSCFICKASLHLLWHPSSSASLGSRWGLFLFLELVEPVKQDPFPLLPPNHHHFAVVFMCPQGVLQGVNICVAVEQSFNYNNIRNWYIEISTLFTFFCYNIGYKINLLFYPCSQLSMMALLYFKIATQKSVKVDKMLCECKTDNLYINVT